ncbi:hypothetical protein [Sphingobacterium endophyticum]|uniref:hypothetical protein n=1 Tax=Sphingobacterium endophyticum TaxID=2546448 RepID=UPI0012E0E7E3|nr:hypothetical protein [Sphingobacterium endophyticum]
MAAPRTLSLLNFLIVALNFLWIAILENAILFDFTFTDTIAFYPSYLTPAFFTYKIWSFIAISMILAAYFMFRGTQEPHYSSNTIKKVEKIDYLLILNQMALGLSMTLKHNDYFFWSILYTGVCLITVLIINNRIHIQKLTSNSLTRYFIRLGFGVYTGWIMFVFGFNSAVILSKLSLQLGEQQFFFLNVAVLLLVTLAMVIYSYYYFLPSVSAVLVWGCYGVYYQANLSDISDRHDIKPYLIFAMLIGAIFTAYNYYRCNVRRNQINIMMEEPPSIP